MADMQYKKGELLLSESVVVDLEGGGCLGTCQTQEYLNQDVLIIEFNKIEYECKAVAGYFGNPMYGGYTSTGPDYSIYPFFICNSVRGPSPEEAEVTNNIELYTENPGTYTIKIYTVVEDANSTPLPSADFIITYLMKSPQNSNWNVLSSLLGNGDWSKLKAYVETTPKNMNRQVLRTLLCKESSDSNAVVGTAVVGTAIIS